MSAAIFDGTADPEAFLDARPCPACPDGQVWGVNGPTGKTCPVCKGHAVIRFDGTPVERTHD